MPFANFSILKYISNLPGWRTNRKIIVIESDDWGSIRMPSMEAFNSLLQGGIDVGRGYYNKFDSLECNKDLESVFEVLSSFKDRNGNHPVFTGVCVVANPDFKKIKESEYQRYYYEPFSETLKRYPAHDRVLDLWKEGAKERLFVPQFHGREHLNVKQWLRDLQGRNKHTMLAFENGLWGISSPLIAEGYQAAFDLKRPEDLDYLSTVIEEGLDLFENIMSYSAKFFVPSNGPFNLKLEEPLHRKGIKYIMLYKRQKEPLGNGRFKTHYHYLGKSNQCGQIYLSRNASFEPSAGGIDWVGSCLKEITISFQLKKPATISTHRVNYIGFLDEKNRERGIRQLSELLGKIINTWPDVEFMTSVDLGDLISNKNYN